MIGSGTNDDKAALTEGVNDTFAQRHLGADKRQIDPFCGGKVRDGLDIIRFNRNKFCLFANSPIARRCIDLANLRTLRQSLDDSVFSSTGSDDKNFHLEETVICVRLSLSAPVR